MLEKVWTQTWLSKNRGNAELPLNTIRDYSSDISLTPKKITRKGDRNLNEEDTISHMPISF